MSASPGWRQVAVKIARYAAAGQPGASPWAQAMRHELDYIEDDRAALAWALGCVLASCKAALAARVKAGLDQFRRPHACGVLRHAAVGGALILAVGLALLQNGGGQAAPAPSAPVPDEKACGTADNAPDSNGNPARRRLPFSMIGAARDPGGPGPETSCAGNSAPVRILPRYDMP